METTRRTFVILMAAIPVAACGTKLDPFDPDFPERDAAFIYAYRSNTYLIVRWQGSVVALIQRPNGLFERPTYDANVSLAHVPHLTDITRDGRFIRHAPIDPERAFKAEKPIWVPPQAAPEAGAGGNGSFQGGDGGGHGGHP